MMNFAAPTAQEMRYATRPLSLVVREGSSVAVLSNEGRAAGLLLLLREATRPELTLESRRLQTAPGTVLLCFTFKAVERGIKPVPIPERAGPALQHGIAGVSKNRF